MFNNTQHSNRKDKIGMRKRTDPSEPELLNISQQLKSKDRFLRAKALESLSRRDGSMAFNLIVSSLSDPSPLVRVTAAETLGQVGNKQAVPHLIDKLTDTNGEVRMRAAESIGLLLSKTEKNLPALLKCLKDCDELVRIAAVESLVLIEDRKSLPALRKSLEDRSPLVRFYIASAIGRLGGRKDIAKLENGLRNERSQIAKVGFYEALCLLGQKKFLEPLLSLLKSKNYKVRCATANVLSDIQYKGADAPLVIRRLHEALKKEETIAAKSSIRLSIQCIRSSAFRAI